jgi:RNA polymerase sigma factor (sigma-70 family)
MTMTDGELLRRYARERSETAFEELVRRRINLIYSAALRQVNNDAHLAEDVTQAVFTDLARKAAKFTHHTSLTAWLYTSTRFIAANIRRTEQRRAAREEEAHAMNAIHTTPETEPDWAQIRPLLDDAMHTLDDQDREAVLLRHFERCSYAEIGSRFGLTEDTARMRVNRALEKLHDALAKRGVTSTAMALAGLLAGNAVGAAPAHLAGKTANVAMTGAGAGGLSVLLAWQIKLALAAVVLAAAVAVVVASRRDGAETSGNMVGAVAAPTNSTVQNAPTVAPSAVSPADAPLTNGAVLHLQIVTADSGKPIPTVPIDYRGWVGGKFEGKYLRSDRFGVCDVSYPSNISELELTTRKEPFADTRLLWRPPRGYVIPTNYVLRLDRAVPIGGSVVDADGNPVAGTKVGWNHEDDPATAKLPQDHEFGWIETTTGKDGRWQINRMADEMIPRIYGNASDSNYVGSGLIFASREKATETQLREGTFVFKLGRVTTAKGMVVDADGDPIPGAKILVGTVSDAGSRKGKSRNDGTFSLGGCPPGKQLVTAEAPGFAATTMEADLGDNAKSIRLILQPGKILRLQVVDKEGTPIPKANVWYNNFVQGPIDPKRPKPVQAQFNPITDQEGRASWTNAPDAEMEFDVAASGFLRVNRVKVRPDGQEHIITLPTALRVHGKVQDEATGQPIPHFRIITGWPNRNPLTGTTNAEWSPFDRFFGLDFANGAYNSYEEGGRDTSYILKFVADDYAPFISRVIDRDEGDVQLDVTLRRAAATTVTVNKPDGQTDGKADVGLVFPGAQLTLTQGGFSRGSFQSGGLLRTAADGIFTLPIDDSITRVIAASQDGYAEATPAELSANPVMQLQPWGRLEVNCIVGGEPAVGREYLFELGGGSPETVSYSFETAHVKTDAQGRFSFSQLPPGKHHLTRLYPAKMGGWAHGEKIPFEIRPGETTTLNLDASGKLDAAVTELQAAPASP